MGSGYRYNGDEPDRWTDVGTVAGVKILEDTQGNSSNLPTYSKTSDAYFKRNKDGEITQMRVYGEKNSHSVRSPAEDIDLRQHPHTNQDGESFPLEIAHVHEYEQKTDKKTGKKKWVRKKEARLLTQKEIELYGEKLKKANPKVKFKMS